MLVLTREVGESLTLSYPGHAPVVLTVLEVFQWTESIKIRLADHLHTLRQKRDGYHNTLTVTFFDDVWIDICCIVVRARGAKLGIQAPPTVHILRDNAVKRTPETRDAASTQSH
jgi:sRNA-binding carbon storage regulator CsrA